ncbi:hypothetical protein EMIHUDRAFT_446502 [Emiliania huxleyi CCMP1516]|uniref:Uncharacterized protein n=2 Tax=Emiliania huxleyi TaxID=2903 RepID=A0A0D3I5F6_EMIH1|nr:hypothetical protein EMIHUDRAFT_446502 [Emiliania huxleyi CCMP1516]EOD06491.1 hypothetical protein EMIHUDRAFT_446502 [Emiliania huxleyi CCMP1516]|eukprot:XP_005758920.1 hypothetical protein EMIHUDRAFT_446502 [Emiliania huxleyi CCMP1516]
MMVHSVRNRQQPFSGWSRSTRQTSTSTTTSQFLEAQKPRSMAAAWIDGGVPRWVTLVDEVLFVVASAAFIKGSLDFFPGVPLQSYIEGINLFFAGSAVYTVLAVFAAYEIVEDAKLSGREAPPAKLVEQALYLLGSVFFLLGTAEFTPPAESSAEDAAVSVSVLGRTFFLGSAASIPEDTLAMGDELFILGSFLFSVAAFISAIDVSGESTGDEVSVLQRRTSVAVASLFELGGSGGRSAASRLGSAVRLGTPCFYPAGPMGMSACPEGTETLTRVGAALFVAGSARSSSSPSRRGSPSGETSRAPTRARRAAWAAGKEEGRGCRPACRRHDTQWRDSITESKGCESSRHHARRAASVSSHKSTFLHTRTT